MTSALKCARCGKKPTVKSNCERSAWNSAGLFRPPPDLVDDQSKLTATGFFVKDRSIVDHSIALRSQGTNHNSQNSGKGKSWKSAELAKPLPDLTCDQNRLNAEGSLREHRTPVNWSGSLRGEGGARAQSGWNSARLLKPLPDLVEDQAKLSKSGSLHRDRKVVDFASSLRSDGSRTTHRTSWKSVQLEKSLDSTCGLMKSNSDGSLRITNSPVDFIRALRSDGANESDRDSQHRVAKEASSLFWIWRTPSKNIQGHEPSEPSSGHTDCTPRSAMVTTEARDANDEPCVDSAHVGSGFQAVRKIRRSQSNVSDCSTSASSRQVDRSLSHHHEANLGEAFAQ